MTGFSMKVELRDSAARQSLQGLLDRMDDRAGFFGVVGEIILASSKDRFATETDPDGTPWAVLSPRTIAARRSRGKSQIAILRDTGRLAGSINYEATASEVLVGSPLEYAAIHQLGGLSKSQRPTLSQM